MIQADLVSAAKLCMYMVIINLNRVTVALELKFYLDRTDYLLACFDLVPASATSFGDC